jgi:hypothetical protein
MAEHRVLMADTIEEIIKVSDWAKMKAAEIVESLKGVRIKG